MVTLHIVSRSQALPDCLRVAATQDEVLLLGDAVAAAGANHGRRLWVLEDDLSSHSKEALAGQAQLTDYAGFVDLVARCQPIVTWH